MTILRRLLVTFVIGCKYLLLWILSLAQVRRLWAWLQQMPYQPLTRPHVLRLAFEDLGPSYIKLGQIVASSPGLFTREYVEEFRHCLDAVKPIPFGVALSIVQHELGSKAADLQIDATPLASASIAQVHAARLPDGQTVVVKIQRPLIAQRVGADVVIMKFWARLAEALLPTARHANPVGIVEDFSKTIAEELDFVGEGRNMDEFNRMMIELQLSGVCAPAVHWEYCTPRVLTMERLFGYKADDADGIRRAGLDGEALLILGIRSWFLSVMRYGFFHGDVHAGNLMFLNDGRAAMLDFGIVGRFDMRLRQLVMRYVMGMALGQYEEIARVMVEIGGVKDNVDMKVLVDDIEKVYGPLRSIGVAQLDYNDLLPKLVAMARRHGTRLPKDFVLILKQVLYFERYARLLAPGLNIFTDPRILGTMMPEISQVLSSSSN